jgi:general secretion pathway protein D
VEALILETSLDGSKNFGVEWFGGGMVGSSLGFGNFGTTGTLGSILGSTATGTVPSIGSLPGGFSTGLIGDTVTYNGMNFPTLGAFLSAVSSDAAVNIVSNPQVITIDNQEGEVFVGENRPYITSEKYDTNNNAIQTFDYRDVGVRLKVIPHIIGDDLVSLEIEQEVNKISPAATFNNSSPVTLTRTTKTKVLLYDKTIMLIGGLMKDDSSVSDSGIPFLSSIPILGWLFKTENTTYEKTNLMAFITVHIIDTKEEMGELLERRAKATDKFNSRGSDLLEASDDNSSFIPMQKEVDEFLNNIDIRE